MYLNMKLRLIVITYLIYAFVMISECRRGGGGRRGTHRGSSRAYSKSKQNQYGRNHDLYGSNRRDSKSQSDVPKPNITPEQLKVSPLPAPKTQDAQKSSSTFINQEQAHNVQQKPIGFEKASQQTNTQQKPIGWNVKQDGGQTSNLNKNPTYNVGHSNPSSVDNPTHVDSQQSYPSAIGNQPSYSVQRGSNYGSRQMYHYGNTPNQGYQAPGYQYNLSMGGMPQKVLNTGLYHNKMNNMGYAPPMGQNRHYGGSYEGGYYRKSGGILSSIFGSNEHNYGNGGNGGLGGYGKKYGGGFGIGFGKNAYRNAFFGLLIWNLISGFTHRPYYVYNYLNNPEKVPQEIPLPADAIVYCPYNVTSLCAPNTAPLCTSNSTFLCVVLAQQTVLCYDNSNIKCVNSEITCNEGTDENCKEITSRDEIITVNVPCIANATVLGKPTGYTVPFVFNQTSDTTTLCVTVIAIPQPEEDIKAAEAAGCGSNSEQAQNSTCVANDSTPV